MANPQPDQYTKFSNELLEALARIRIPGEARQMLDVIFRKTYGFQKKEDQISLSQFALATGLVRPLVVRGLSKLITLNIIIIKKENTITNIYKINKDFDTWKPLSKKIRGVSKKIIKIIKKDNLLLSKKRQTKETLTKETLTKEPTSLQSVILFYFIIKDYIKDGESIEDKTWVKQNFARPAKAAKRLLALGTADEIKAMITKGKAYFEEKSLDWKLETIEKCWNEIKAYTGKKRYS